MIDLPGSALDPEKLQGCLLPLQSYVLSPGYFHESLLSQTLDNMRGAFESAEVIFVATVFRLWDIFCGPEFELFLSI